MCSILRKYAPRPVDDSTLGPFENLWSPGTSGDPLNSTAPRPLDDSWTPWQLNQRTIGTLDHARLVPSGAWKPLEPGTLGPCALATWATRKPNGHRWGILEIAHTG